MSDVRSDSELVVHAAGGDRDAFAELCERHKQRLWRVTAGVARGADAEDLAQEAIVRAWCAIESCRSASSFDAWICRIAINAAHDYHRSAWRRRVVLLENPAPDTQAVDDTVQTAERRETARRLRRAVAALPQRQCIPIWMHYFEQFSLAEIAVLEGTAESTVRSRIRVGMHRLRYSLADLVTEQPTAGETIAAVKGAQI